MTTPDQPRLDRAEEIAQAWRREQPGLPVDSIGILTRIQHTAKLLADERRRVLAQVGMDAATLDLLSTLRRSGRPYRLSTRELATRCLITPGAVTQRVDRARDEGFVRRLTAHPGTRAVPVELTPEGHRAVENAVDTLLTYEQGLIEVLSPHEQQALTRLLVVLLQDLNDRAHRRAGDLERPEDTDPRS
ncbi:MarR family transcriptional regulator [Streptomyces sp. NPDC005573]|uniref:MarR family winged helix-turn-helix transcriptional regulator n=1 Tax=Streptomyces sp. NPDC005573 TaxID=3156890 RepID=UPI0033BBD28C